MTKYNICFSLDINYIEQLIVSITSILKNAQKNDNIIFHILNTNLSNQDKEKISRLNKIKSFEINYIQIDPKDFKECPMKDNYHVTLPTYFRFKIPQLIQKVDKILYLDCDVIVRSSLKKLFSTNINKNSVAMIKDANGSQEAQRLNLANYFNAGIMLINLKYWRKNNITEELFSFAKSNKDIIKWQDQDVINCVLAPTIKELPIQYNYQCFLYETFEYEKLKNCTILHFAGNVKPWSSFFTHAAFNEYYHYLSLTPFKNKVGEYKSKCYKKYVKSNYDARNNIIFVDENTPKISVIIPIYNVEKYLAECLNSVINQSFKDIEIICVNDGSTDNSLKIIQDFANQDKRIKIVNKNNGGLSSARNAGLEVATGEFISFIDSDDWIDSTMLERMYKNISDLNTDICICAVHCFDELNQVINDSEAYYTLKHFDNSFDNRAFSYEETKDFIMDVCVMAWNKLYRKSFLDSCNATFPEGLIFEDGPFFFSIFFKTKRVSIVREFLYYYRINRSGSILQKHNKNLIDIIDIVNLMYNEINKTPIFEEMKHTFYKKKADDIFYRYELTPLKYKKEFREKFKKYSCLTDRNTFDYKYIKETMPITYTNMNVLEKQKTILSFYLQKIKIRLMYKVIQILCTEPDRYYFKFWAVKFWLKKRANIFDVWYENDKIIIILLKKLRFELKFEFSKI